MVESALLVVNRPSGVGRGVEDIDRIQRAFHAAFPSIATRVLAVTDGHDAVVRRTRHFLATAPRPCVLLAGGGSGTTRALVQGLMEDVDAGTTRLADVQVSALRLGSANVIAKHFGVPRDAGEAMRVIASGLVAGRTSPCCVYRCAFQYPTGEVKRMYGVTLGGLGGFAGVPEEASRWKREHPILVRRLTSLVPLEAVTTAQYFLLTLRAAMRSGRGDLVEVRRGGRSERYRFLAGFLLNFDLPRLPVRGGCGVGDPRLALCLVPHEGRAMVGRMLLDWRQVKRSTRQYQIAPGAAVEIAFPEVPSTTVSLDQDTFEAPGRMTFEIGGLLRFITGPGNGVDPVPQAKALPGTGGHRRGWS